MLRGLEPLTDDTDQKISELITGISGLPPGEFGYVLLAVPFTGPDVRLVRMWADTGQLTQISALLHKVLHQLGAAQS
jgi:hypothetical protein